MGIGLILLKDIKFRNRQNETMQICQSFKSPTFDVANIKWFTVCADLRRFSLLAKSDVISTKISYTGPNRLKGYTYFIFVRIELYTNRSCLWWVGNDSYSITSNRFITIYTSTQFY